MTSLQLRTFGRPLLDAWVAMQAACAAEYPSFPSVARTIAVDNVNDTQTLDLIASQTPDVVLVSGTNLVGKRLMAACRDVPILNLHTGISPYVKGGPNCTNWCLAEQLFHLIGSTVLWLDPGIDTGDIAATERAPLTFNETLGELQIRVIHHAHDLYVRSIAALSSSRPLNRVSQASLGQGRTFYSRDWNGRAILRAQSNFKRHYSSSLPAQEAFRRLAEQVRLVGLHSNGS